MWPAIEPLLALACRRTHGRWTAERALAGLKTGEQQLFVAVRNRRPLAAVTTAITPAADGDWLTVVLCGGRELKTWLPAMLDALTLWQRETGCIGQQIVGRLGWARAAGFRPIMTVMEKRDG